RQVDHLADLEPAEQDVQILTPAAEPAEVHEHVARADAGAREHRLRRAFLSENRTPATRPRTRRRVQIGIEVSAHVTVWRVVTHTHDVAIADPGATVGDGQRDDPPVCKDRARPAARARVGALAREDDLQPAQGWTTAIEMRRFCSRIAASRSVAIAFSSGVPG